MKRSQSVVKKTFFTALFLLLSVSILVLFTACVQGADAGVNKVDTIAVTGITLNKTVLELTVGATEKLTATVIPENATNKKVKWSSSNDGIAIVNEDGTITAKAVGEVVITVKTDNGSYTASCTVKVKATVEQLIRKAVDDVLAKTKLTNAGLPYIDPNTQNTDEIEKYLSPLGMARKDDKPDSKLVLFYKLNDLRVEPKKREGKITYIGDRDSIIKGIDLVRQVYTAYTESDKDNSIKLPDPDPYEFNSIADVLDWKWKNFKSDIPYLFVKAKTPWFEKWSPTVYNTLSSEGICQAYSIGTDSVLKVAIKPLDFNGVIEPWFYFYNSIYKAEYAIIDLEVTFIRRNNSSLMYTFRVGPYYMSNKKPHPSYDDSESDGKYQDINKVHVFRLSTLVRMALEEKLKVSLETPGIIDLLKTEHNIGEDDAKKQIASEIKGTVKDYLDNFPPFEDNFNNLNDWDVYISFDKYSGEMKGKLPNEMWRNTYKITGGDAMAFWKKCWE